MGSPLPETQALVLTANGRLAGLGEMGEIAIRTPFRSLGYLGLPAENEARFRNGFSCVSSVEGQRKEACAEGSVLAVLPDVLAKGFSVRLRRLDAITVNDTAVHAIRRHALGERDFIDQVIALLRDLDFATGPASE